MLLFHHRITTHHLSSSFISLITAFVEFFPCFSLPNLAHSSSCYLPSVFPEVFMRNIKASNLARISFTHSLLTVFWQMIFAFPDTGPGLNFKELTRNSSFSFSHSGTFHKKYSYVIIKKGHPLLSLFTRISQFHVTSFINHKVRNCIYYPLGTRLC